MKKIGFQKTNRKANQAAKAATVAFSTHRMMSLPTLREKAKAIDHTPQAKAMAGGRILETETVIS